MTLIDLANKDEMEFFLSSLCKNLLGPIDSSFRKEMVSLQVFFSLSGGKSCSGPWYEMREEMSEVKFVFGSSVLERQMVGR